MSTYIFITGKDRDLSLAELSARFSEAKFIRADQDYVILSIETGVGQAVFNQLGGVIKVGEVLRGVDRGELTEVVVEHLSSTHQNGKLNYGISLYGQSEKNLRGILLSVKKSLRKRGVSSRFANQDFKNLSTAQHKGLGKKGIELLVVFDGQSYHVASVGAVQDIDAYSLRDYRKPFRNMKVGMLPPKLAQILINLAGPARSVWDPFCGGGVLLMEGVLMGKQMLGSDIDPKALEGARRNCDWLAEAFDIRNRAELFQHDATKPFPKQSFDAIVFEGYLGPPQKEVKTEAELRPVIDQLNGLYLDFFRQVRSSGFKGPVVAALPFFQLKNGRTLSLDRLYDQLIDMGFKKDTLISGTDKTRIQYARPDQRVGREIIRVYPV
jgi:tRNA G10  N-methylase Trm11